EEAQDVFAVVLASERRYSCVGIEPAAFFVRCVVQEIPDVKEAVARHRAAGILVQVVEACYLATELNVVAPHYLGSYVLQSVCPLIQDAADIRTELIEGYAAGHVYSVTGQANRRLRVRVDFIPPPSGSIHAQFIQERGREGAVPNSGEGIVDLLVMEEVIGAVGSIHKVVRQRNPEHGVGQAVFAADVSIETAVVLRSGEVGCLLGDVVGDVGDAVKSAADAGVRRALPTWILRAQCRCQRGSNIQALTRNRSAIHTFY